MVENSETIQRSGGKQTPLHCVSQPASCPSNFLTGSSGGGPSFTQAATYCVYILHSSLLACCGGP